MTHKDGNSIICVGSAFFVSKVLVRSKMYGLSRLDFFLMHETRAMKNVPSFYAIFMNECVAL